MGRAQRLRERFATAPVTVIQIDALSLKLPHRPFRVVASPPYAISSALLRVLLRSGSRLAAADLVLQQAVVRRHAVPLGSLSASTRVNTRPGGRLPGWAAGGRHQSCLGVASRGDRVSGQVPRALRGIELLHRHGMSYRCGG